MVEKNEQKERVCFIIAPIGDDGSPTRDRSNNVMDFIITPALEKCGYKVPPLRADHLPNPGRITRQIIEQLLEADLVVADLTDHNPNVFYELAIRHATRKPVVQIIHRKDRIPFDVANQRTIFYDHENLRLSNQAVEEIIRQIRSVEANPEDVDTPLTEAILIQSLARSEDPIAQSNAEIIAALQDIRSELSVIRRHRDVSSTLRFPNRGTILDVESSIEGLVRSIQETASINGTVYVPHALMKKLLNAEINDATTVADHLCLEDDIEVTGSAKDGGYHFQRRKQGEQETPGESRTLDRN